VKSSARILYYLHDWNYTSDRNSPELKYISNKYAKKYKYDLFSTGPIDYKTPHYIVREIIRTVREMEAKEVVLIGSGVGAWLARIIQLTYFDKLDKESSCMVWSVGFNPTIEPHKKLLNYTGQMHTDVTTGKIWPWNKLDCEEIQALHESVNYTHLEFPNIVFIPQKNTKIIDYHKEFSSVFSIEGNITSLNALKVALKIFEDFREYLIKKNINIFNKQE